MANEDFKKPTPVAAKAGIRSKACKRGPAQRAPSDSEAAHRAKRQTKTRDAEITLTLCYALLPLTNPETNQEFSWPILTNAQNHKLFLTQDDNFIAGNTSFIQTVAQSGDETKAKRAVEKLKEFLSKRNLNDHDSFAATWAIQERRLIFQEAIPNPIKLNHPNSALGKGTSPAAKPANSPAARPLAVQTFWTPIPAPPLPNASGGASAQTTAQESNRAETQMGTFVRTGWASGPYGQVAIGYYELEALMPTEGEVSHPNPRQRVAPIHIQSSSKKTSIEEQTVQETRLKDVSESRGQTAGEQRNTSTSSAKRTPTFTDAAQSDSCPPSNTAPKPKLPKRTQDEVTLNLRYHLCLTLLANRQLVKWPTFIEKDTGGKYYVTQEGNLSPYTGPNPPDKIKMNTTLYSGSAKEARDAAKSLYGVKPLSNGTENILYSFTKMSNGALKPVPKPAKTNASTSRKRPKADEQTTPSNTMPNTVTLKVKNAKREIKAKGGFTRKWPVLVTELKNIYWLGTDGKLIESDEIPEELKSTKYQEHIDALENAKRKYGGLRSFTDLVVEKSEIREPLAHNLAPSDKETDRRRSSEIDSPPPAAPLGPEDRRDPSGQLSLSPTHTSASALWVPRGNPENGSSQPVDPLLALNRVPRPWFSS